MARKLTLTKRIIYMLQALILCLILGFFRLLPLEIASNVGSFLARKLGPYLRWQQIAKKNLSFAMPELEQTEQQQILNGMWDNLGRNFAELAWMGHPDYDQRIQLKEPKPGLIKELEAEPMPILFLSGHLGNWEAGLASHRFFDKPITAIYRHMNNPYVEKILYRLRNRHKSQFYPKGKTGARAVLRALKKNEVVGLLIDQKMNDGGIVPFFGHEAPTVMSPAEFALRQKLGIILARVIRQPESHFVVEMQSVEYQPNESPEQIMGRLNDQLEAWIRQHPEQWLWIHQRWGKWPRSR